MKLAALGLPIVFAVSVLAGPRHGLAQQNFSADIRASGGALDSPATGAMYFNGAKTRLEFAMDGQSVVMLFDHAQSSLTMLMVAEKMYMAMPIAMIPFQIPSVDSLDPTDPCSNPGITACVSLGQEEVNGYTSAGWQYVQSGASFTSWISTELGLPVRIISEDGTTADFSNLSQDPIDASLFEIPSDYQPMQGLPG